LQLGRQEDSNHNTFDIFLIEKQSIIALSWQMQMIDPKFSSDLVRRGGDNNLISLILDAAHLDKIDYVVYQWQRL
jgi:hypothetical protein